MTRSPLPWRTRFLSAFFALGTAFIAASPAHAQLDPTSDFERAILPSPMATQFADSIKTESPSFLSLWLQNTALKEADFKDPASFTIQSSDDPAYAPDKKIAPISISARCRTTRVSNRKTLLVKTTAVFLELPTPMKPGASYTITSTLAGIPSAPVKFSDKTSISDNIHVNQVGYLPTQEKIAYLGQYAGTRGPLPFTAQSFELLDRNGKSVFTGKPTRRTIKPTKDGQPIEGPDQSITLTGQELYDLDFTPFNTPGTYRLYVPGVGISYPFDLGPSALNVAYINLMRGNLIQRCGCDIPLSITRHGHEACHIDDAFVDPAALTSNFVQQPKDKKGTVPIYKPVHEKEQRKATGGHHDAGDYGKYTSNGCNFIAYPLQLMRLYPDKFQEDNLGLPNSGNNIPDILEEVKWELDWVENMQDDDGGVFGVIRPNGGGYENSVPPRTNKRFMFPKDTNYTAAFAAALAHASTHPQIIKYYPQDAKRYREKALKAWAWLEQNKAYTEYWHYGALFKDSDELAWAAVELYAATGDAKFHDYFLKNFKPEEARWGWVFLVESVGHAARRYAFLSERDTDPAMKKRCRDVILKAADAHVSNTNAYPFRMAMPPESIRFSAYGWVFPAAQFSYDLLVANAINPSDAYTKAALSQVNYTLGANPFSYALNTGIGFKRNIEIVHNPSSFDRIIEPAPGIPNGIGSAGFYWLNQYAKTPGEGVFPQNWPLMNRWYDGFNVNTEFTVDMSIRETLTLGFFTNVTSAIPAKPVHPTVAISADNLTGPAPLAVKFSPKVTPAVSGPGGRIRYWFWDFDDESFSCDPSPAHTFADDGREYNVTLTVMDENGNLGSQTVKVACKRKNASSAYPGTPLTPTKATVLYLPFDGSTDDAGPNKLKVETVAARPNNLPMQLVDTPTWMDKPAGQALAMYGREQLKITVPSAMVIKPNTPITIQAMLYIEDFAGWGWDGDATSLGLNVPRRDDSSLNMRQDKWDRSNTPRVGAGKIWVTDAKTLGPAIPRFKWFHFKLTYNGTDNTELFIDGKKIAEAPGPALNRDINQNLLFYVGPFVGMVDEVTLTTQKQ
jgi:PKD repeat protein